MNKQHVQRLEQNAALCFHFKNDITGEEIEAKCSPHTAAKLEAALTGSSSRNALGVWNLTAVRRQSR